MAENSILAARSIDDLDREKKELEVLDLRERVSAHRKPAWNRIKIELAIPWILALLALTWQIVDANRKFDAEQQRAEAQQKRAEKAETHESSLRASLDATAERISNLQTTLRTTVARLESAKPQPEPAKPLSSPTVETAVDRQLEQEAQANIRWVFADSRAKGTYDAALAKIGNKFAAVIQAQSHNPRAQQVIQQYGEARTLDYIKALGG